MGFVILFICVILISLIIAFVAIRLQCLIIGIPFSYFFRKNEKSHALPEPIRDDILYPELGWYITRLQVADPQKWLIVSDELLTYLSNPNKPNLKNVHDVFPFLLSSVREQIKNTENKEIEKKGKDLVSALYKLKMEYAI